MIIREKENWFKMLFVWKGSVLPVILPRMAVLLLLSVVVVFFKGRLFEYKVPLNPAAFTLLGVALAIFLGFRNNASYERFWEGRKLWGALLIDTRSLTRQALTMSGLRPDAPQVLHFVRLLIAFSYALKHQLRKTNPAQDFQRLLPPALVQALEQARFKPILLLKEMGQWVQAGKEAGQIDSITQATFDHNLNQLSYIVGGCERIASTPIPYTYNVLLHRTVYLYCFLLPFGLVDSIGWMTPLIVVFVGYTFMALDSIVNEIEEPFGTEPNDLALNAICQTIEASLLEMAGQEVPPVLAPKNRFILD
ncbi:bestrophin family protein [Rufibacter psychrotolerans]|uniref:bestrophin family protein n=1 Tax=Rufibacter psychrotolerans TaxID=2812556 RepID=UPI001967E0A5|nr:bestrophin family ion channel [Rufibacter sp. SYSU D00308]